MIAMRVSFEFGLRLRGHGLGAERP